MTDKREAAMRQALIEESALQATEHPSKDARFFAKSVHDYLTVALEQPAIPQGWKMVPVKPTKEMARAFWQNVSETWMDTKLVDVYRAMLNAAPTPPKE